jgi:hypothetical protein
VDRSLRLLTFKQEISKKFGSPSQKKKLLPKKRAMIALFRQQRNTSNRRFGRHNRKRQQRISFSRETPLFRGRVVYRVKQKLSPLKVADHFRSKKTFPDKRKTPSNLYYTQKQLDLMKARKLIRGGQLWTPPGANNTERDMIVYNRWAWFISFQVPWRWRKLTLIAQLLKSNYKTFSNKRIYYPLTRISKKYVKNVKKENKKKAQAHRRKQRAWWPKSFYIGLNRMKAWWSRKKAPRRIKGWLNYPDNTAESDMNNGRYTLDNVRTSRNRIFCDKAASLYQPPRFNFRVSRRYNPRKLNSVALVLRRWKAKPYVKPQKFEDKSLKDRKYIEFAELYSRMIPTIERKLKELSVEKPKKKQPPRLGEVLVQKQKLARIKKRIKSSKVKPRLKFLKKVRRRRLSPKRTKGRSRFSARRRARRFNLINKSVDLEAAGFAPKKPYFVSEESLDSWPEKLERAKKKRTVVSTENEERDFPVWLQHLRNISRSKKPDMQLLTQQMKSKLFGVFLRKGHKHDLEKKIRLFSTRYPRWSVLRIYRRLYCPVTMVATKRITIKLGVLRKSKGLLARLDRPKKAFVRARHWLASAARRRQQRRWWSRTVAELLNPRGATRSSRRYAKEVSRVAASN